MKLFEIYEELKQGKPFYNKDLDLILIIKISKRGVFSFHYYIKMAFAEYHTWAPYTSLRLKQIFEGEWENIVLDTKYFDDLCSEKKK